MSHRAPTDAEKKTQGAEKAIMACISGIPQCHNDNCAGDGCRYFHGEKPNPLSLKVEVTQRYDEYIATIVMPNPSANMKKLLPFTLAQWFRKVICDNGNECFFKRNHQCGKIHAGEIKIATFVVKNSIVAEEAAAPKQAASPMQPRPTTATSMPAWTAHVPPAAPAAASAAPTPAPTPAPTAAPTVAPTPATVRAAFRTLLAHFPKGSEIWCELAMQLAILPE